MDTEGFPVAIVVHEANIQDRDGAALVAKELDKHCPTIELVWADAGYRGKGIKNLRRDHRRVELVVRGNERGRGLWHTSQVPLFTVKRGFELVKRRWVVERSFAWLGRFRRLSKDYEATVWSSTAWLYAGFLRVLVQRLAYAD